MTNPTRMLRLPDVLELRGCSKSKLYADIRAGRFPKPCKLGPRLSAWPESDLEAEILAMMAARDATAAQGSAS